MASLSACHKLWYLHFCAVEGVTVQAYRDEAEGVMVEDPERGGAFARSRSNPRSRSRRAATPRWRKRCTSAPTISASLPIP